MIHKPDPELREEAKMADARVKASLVNLLRALDPEYVVPAELAPPEPCACGNEKPKGNGHE